MSSAGPKIKNWTKSYTTIVLAVIITLAVIVIFNVIVLPNVTGTTPTPSSTTTSSSTSTSTVNPSPSNYVCVRAVSDYNGTPIEGLEFNCSPASVQNGTTTVTQILLNVKTNSSGWACVQWTHSDVMTFKTEYQGRKYNFTVPMFLGENYAVLSLPSGKITTTSLTTTPTTTCTITGGSAGAAVRVLSDAGSPIAGAQLSGTQINPCGNSNVPPILTDSNGLVALPGKVGTYNVTLTYEGHLYNVNIPMYPVRRTEVTLHVPSGIFSVEVIPYGDRPVLSGPSFTSTSGGLQLNVTLGNYTVQAGSFQPIRVAFVGIGAWNASYAHVNVIVNNLAGENVWNHTERIPALYSISYTSLLQEFICYNGWIPRTNNVPVTPGEYILVLSVDVDGHLLRVQGTVQVV